jgi:hypothetical protein
MKRRKNILNNPLFLPSLAERGRGRGEKQNASYISRGVAAVFQVSDSNPRERLGDITFATEVVLLENKVKMRFNNSIVNSK